MRVATLQLDSKLGRVKLNTERATRLVDSINPGTLGLLVLPELAFSGYNFPTLDSITPFLEPTAAGPSTAWAVKTAQHLRCTVIVGYPEITSDNQRYNSTVMIGSDGEVLGNGYRKSFLYYTDQTWAAEGSGFKAGLGTVPIATIESQKKSAANITQGICMDLNPYNFTAPWNAYEFAAHVVESDADAAVMSMAWLTGGPDLSSYEPGLDPFADDGTPAWSETEANIPHLDTVNYWIERLTPLISCKRYTIVVMANRCGKERSAIYAGTSCVLRVGHGKIIIYSIMSRGLEGVQLVDTHAPPKAELRLRNPDELDEADEAADETADELPL
ncbi:hypothetical protein FH972_025711 [Carpinus fangiana]|uniref:CN hydrolase domain-containing protein n=1 Tax=Carpinus fangiana TaxID=176857 RepID=A0A5N6L1W8_9ROSI|nr:hypothetical protein FH972_025711 [Carpinus fangiana]